MRAALKDHCGSVAQGDVGWELVPSCSEGLASMFAKEGLLGCESKNHETAVTLALTTFGTWFQIAAEISIGNNEIMV